MTLQEMLNELVLSVGHDDSNIRLVLTRGINAGIIAATVKYHPPEYKGIGYFTCQPEFGFIHLNSTDWLQIETVWNTTADIRVWPMTHNEMMAFKVFLTGTNVKYYAVYGDTLYYQPYPSVVQTLAVGYFALPDRVVELSDDIPLNKHIEYIMAFAMEFYWASKEEGESQQVWQRVADRISMPFEQMSLIQRGMKEEPPYDDKLRNLVQ